ncbi:MAG: prephenate dehydratase [Chromatiales bacterium]|jgi:chorismate mutase/prephenate dehydratase|nr:prephenate dehydratase [Chromatiales bacterium]
MAGDDELKRIRDRIDQIDEQLQTLISERARCALEVAAAKRARGDDVFYRPEREAQVLQTVNARNTGPLDEPTMTRLFREIMSACLALQRPMTVAYLGPEGTFTEAAVRKHFGHSVGTRPLAAIDEVFREVEAGTADFGVVPIENSSEGAVDHTLDMFMSSPLKICSEVELRVHHNLMGTMPTLDGVKRIYAHRMALAQCREWLDTHFAGIEREAVSSNAEAARRARGEEGAAAIASAHAAEVYGLKLLAQNIEDEPDNTTRFLVIGRSIAQPSGRDKTSLLLSTANRPGALYRLLAPLAEHGITMTRIESRPSRRGMWDYVFFIDIAGHCRDSGVATAIAALELEAAMVKILGSYPES